MLCCLTGVAMLDRRLFILRSLTFPHYGYLFSVAPIKVSDKQNLLLRPDRDVADRLKRLVRVLGVVLPARSATPYRFLRSRSFFTKKREDLYSSFLALKDLSWKSMRFVEMYCFITPVLVGTVQENGRPDLVSHLSTLFWIDRSFSSSDSTCASTDFFRFGVVTWINGICFYSKLASREF